MANLKPKKPKTNNNYYWFLLLPVAAIVILVILLIPKSKHFDWDDDDDDPDSPSTGLVTQRGHSAIDRFTDEELLNIPEAPDPEWGGNSPAFRKEVAPGIVISARKNAFEKPTEVKFRFATEAEHKKACQAVQQQLQYHTPLFSFDLDAGLESTQRIPGTFHVELDMDKLDIPEETRNGIRVCRIDENGNVQEWNSSLDGNKFSFDTDKNCLWLLTFSAVAVITAKIGMSSLVVGGITLVGSAPLLMSYGNLELYFFRKTFVYDYFKVPHYGTISIGFCPDETEHPNPAKYIKAVKDVNQRLAELQEKAEQDERDIQDYHRSLRNADNPIPIYIGVDEKFSFARLYADYLVRDSELKKLLKELDKEKPQSIKDIEKMVEVSIVYLKDVQGLKVPGSMCGIYLGDNGFVGGSNGSRVEGAYNHFCGLNPWLGINYLGNYVVKEGTETVNGVEREKRIIKESVKDKLLMTVCHELFHHFHSSYVINSFFRDSRLAESTAAVLEHDFTDWLYETGKLDFDPRSREGDNKLQYADRSPKYWLLGALTRPVMPSFANLDQLGELCKATLVTLMRSAMLTNNDELFVDTTEMNRRIRAQKEAIDEMSRRANLSFEQLCDIFGYVGELKKGGPNCDAGYMLGDFIDYLRENVNRETTLHDILMYGSGWNLAEAFKKGFGIESEEKFYEHYEGFILKNIKDIVSKQYRFVTDESTDYHSLYYNQLMPLVNLTPQDCVHELKCWAHADNYACRTVSFFNRPNNGNYNLLLIPSPELKGDGEKAVKAAILKGDSVLAPNPYYLEADSNGNRSPESVVMLLTHKFREYESSCNSMYGVPFSDDDYYYDAVAYFAPREKPIVNSTPNGDYRFLFKEKPVEVLKKKKYVTGVEFMLKDNRTGKPVASQKVPFPEDSSEPLNALLTYPNRRAGEEPDVSGYARWYYQPNPRDTTSYYSPWSETGEAGGGLLIDNDTYLYDMGPFRNPSSNLTSLPKGHLKVWSDGRFEWRSPAASSENMSVSAFTVSGQGKLGARLSQVVVNVDGVLGEIDSLSFHSSGLTVNEKQWNERGEEYTVTTEYSVRNVQDAFICYKNPRTPGATIKVILNFPKAVRRRGNGASEESLLEFFGYGEERERSTSPFLDD